MRTENFNRFFKDGASIQVRQMPCTIHVLGMGELVVPTGQIVACDPSYDDVFVFAQSVPTGRYPVEVAQIRDVRFGVRNLAMQVILAVGEVARWTMGVPKGNDPAALGPHEVFCYGVDSGLGCFMDMRASVINQDALYHDDGSYWDTITDHLWTHNDGVWMNREVDATSGANMMVVQSGWGDGCYASYWGWSSEGECIRLLTDFGLADSD